MAKIRQKCGKILHQTTYSNLTEINDFIYFFSNQNNLSYCQKDKKHSEINMNLSKIVTYCVTFHFLESVNMSVSRGVSKLLCVFKTLIYALTSLYIRFTMERFIDIFNRRHNPNYYYAKKRTKKKKTKSKKKNGERHSTRQYSVLQGKSRVD